MDTTGKRPTTTTTTGRVAGRFRGSDVVEFRGIPYAEPPVGDLRWAPPQAHEPWAYVRDCRKYSPVAWQRGGDDQFFRAVINGLGLSAVKTKLLLLGVKWAPLKESEDCLTLNILAPREAENLPVMVWIHGGDHTDGAGSSPPYRGEALPRRGCVLVTINYRLGLFGFYGHRDLAAESEDGSFGNFGLLDQIAALRWVKENATSFGGDPSNITVFGESAGGRAVLNLMSAPAARGLFTAAIAQSPCDSGMWLDADRATLRSSSVIDASSRFAEAAVGAGDDQLARLRSMSAADLMELYRSRDDLAKHFYPFIGGAELAKSPYTTFADGEQAAVPLICGHNSDEGSAFVDSTHPAGNEYDDLEPGLDDIRVALSHAYSGEDVEALIQAYPGLDSGIRGAISSHLGDHMFGVQVEHVARCHAQSGNSTFRYHFRGTPGSQAQSIGAFHAADIAPLFDTSFPFVDPAEGYRELSEAMGECWTTFAQQGVPPATVGWPAYDPDEPRYMVFERAVDGRAPVHLESVEPMAGSQQLHRRFTALIEADRA